MTKPLVVGPGSVRVGQFIGRVGVVSLPAVEVAVDLDQRVMRRHVAKLEQAGWLTRAPWIWGEGSVAWLTSLGTEASGLGGLRPVKAPPARTTISHAVLVGWSAARLERRGRDWKSARELALNPERWSVTMRAERGYTTQLPDLVGWARPSAPVALIAESGGRREDRQKMLLEGWRDAVWSGRYAAVRYDCSTASVAHWIARLAKKIGLDRPKFAAHVQTTAEEIAALCAAAEADERAAEESQLHAAGDQTVSRPNDAAPVPVPSPPPPAQPDVPASVSAPATETAEAAGERDRLYREIFGIEDEQPRRRWRRSS
jgi:hypothetical protein